jgi:hypothetical protein
LYELKVKATNSHLPRAVTHFFLILTEFLFIYALSWPIVFSLDLWVFKDRGSLLNLDYLLEKHFRLGVDTYYAYGLLPVLLQHLLFAAFGRGHWPMIGCAVVALVLLAAFCALLLRYLPEQKIWGLIFIAISPIFLWVNPNFPSSLLQLSILFALLFVLERRLDIAMAVAAVGCLSVPSLSLVLTALLLFLIVVDWWITTNHSPAYLVRQLAPGVSTYVLLVVVLIIIYGYQSVLATALPVQGMQHYQAMHYSVWDFLHPPGDSLQKKIGYTLGTRVAWWASSTVVLLVLGGLAAEKMIRQRALDPQNTFIALCAILQGVFAFLAYGSHGQHVIYDPLLAAGMLIGLSRLPSGSFRKTLLVLFVGLGILSHSSQAYKTWWAWKDTRPYIVGGSIFYAEPAWAAEWSNIVEISTRRKLVLLSYGTGVHHYFPTIQTADAWFLQPGQLFPADEQRLLFKMDEAEVVVEDLSSPTVFIDTDEGVQARLKSLCHAEPMANFRLAQACGASIQAIPQQAKMTR